MREPGVLEILSEIGDARLSGLLELLPDSTEILVPPREGAILVRSWEGLGSTFHLGEALVTSCRVLVGETEGWAMVLGGDPKRSLVGAVVDALERGAPDSPELVALKNGIDDAKREILDRRAEEASLAASTRVDFDLLPGA